MQDRNFDELAEHFEKKIYKTRKGQLRLDVLWHDLIERIPAIESTTSLRVLDIGCGLGQVGLKLAARGHEVVLCDISRKMLELARRQYECDGVSGQVKFIHSDIQSLPNDHDSSYDLVLFHAVLEWLAHPQATLLHVINRLTSSGRLSLMFYNLDGLVWRNLIRGNLRKVKSGNFRGDPKSLTPHHPLRLSEAMRWLHEAGMRVTSTSGIRVFYDYMARDAREDIAYEDLLEMELSLFNKPPYCYLGRYLHLICEKA